MFRCGKSARICAGLVLFLVLATSAMGQPPNPPPPAAVGPPTAVAPPVQVPGPQQWPAGDAFPPPPPPVGFPGGPGPAVPYDPFFQPRFQDPGFFAGLELGVVQPVLQGRLSAPVQVNGITRTVNVPHADLNWTGSPRIEFGYRFPEGVGSVYGAYRSVVSEGTENIFGFDPPGPAHLRSRLNMNIVDIGYASPEMPIAPFWDFRWDVGARIGTVYYDSRARGSNRSQRVANNFVGAGPRAGASVYRYLDGAPGWALYGKLEGAVVVGETTQSFEEVRRGPKGTQLGGATRFSESQSVPVLGLQAGLSYAPPQSPNWLRFTFGYQYEQWWNVGDAGRSSGDVLFHGFFFRGEFNY